MGKRLTWKTLSLLLVLTFLLFLHCLVDYVNIKRKSFSKIRENFAQEVTTSLHVLSRQMEDIVAILREEKKLNLFDTNFSKRFFFSELSLSELDEVQVFSSDCMLIGVFSLFDDHKLPCFKGGEQKFYVSDYKGSPTVSLVKILEFEKNTYRIQGSFHLGSAWLRERPFLEASLAKESISIVSEKSESSSFVKKFYSFFPNEKRGEEESQINLFIEQYQYGIFPSLFAPNSSLFLKGGNILLLLSMFLCFLIFVEGSLLLRREKKIYENLKKWCEDASKMEDKELYAHCLKELRSPKKNGSLSFYDDVTSLVSKKLQSNFDTQMKLKKMEKELEIYQKKSEESLDRKIHLTIYKSFLDQLKSFSSSLQYDLNRLESIGEKTFKKVTEGLGHNLQTLEKQLSEWKKEATEVGYRKLMRNLQEREGLVEGSSMLEEQVNFFQGVSSSLTCELENVSSLCKESLRRKKEISSVLEHWRDFLFDQEKEILFFDLLESSINLYKIARPKVSFLIEQTEIDLSTPQKLKKNLFMSALYHIFEAYALSQDESSSLIFKLKFASEAQKDFFLISPKETRSRGFNEAGLRSLGLAEELLRTLGMRLSRLKLGESLLLSIEWERITQSLTKREKALQHELGL